MTDVAATPDDVVGFWGVLRMLRRPTFDDLRRDPVTFLRLYGNQAADYSRARRWVEDVSERAIRFAREHGEIRAGDSVSIKDGEPVRVWRFGDESRGRDYSVDLPSASTDFVPAGQVFGTPNPDGDLTRRETPLSDIYRVRFTTFGVTSASDGEATLEGRGRIEPWRMGEVQRRVGDAILESACQIFEGSLTASGWTASAILEPYTVDRLFGDGLKMSDIKLTWKPGETRLPPDGIAIAQTDGPATLVEPRPAIIRDVTERGDSDEWSSQAEHEIEYPRTGVEREMLVSHHRSSVVVVAVNDDGQFVTVRQWKHAIGRVTVEFPAGYLEHELEDPVAAGMRELREETGCESDHWLYLGSFYREPGRGRTMLHVCVALDCEASSEQSPDDTEEIDSGTATLSDVEAMMRDGRMPGLHCLGAWAIARPYVVEALEES